MKSFKKGFLCFSGADSEKRNKFYQVALGFVLKKPGYFGTSPYLLYSQVNTAT